MAKTRKMRKITKAKGKRGRKPIFSGEQKRVLLRMIRAALKENIRGIARAMQQGDAPPFLAQSQTICRLLK